ncbi:MAG: molybdopterin-dependent oxidoreductase [Acidimicrobiales bacterium]|nr:molybdopterin-dependent oxidoreductase [Acidimicrobiales bacterium]
MLQRTFCRVCPAVCGLLVDVQGDRVLSVRGDPDHPLSAGYSCAKGRSIGEVQAHPDRLDHPLVDGVRAGWDETLDDLAARVGDIVTGSGPDAVAVYHGTWSWMDSVGRWAAERLWRRLGSSSVYSAITVDAVNRSAVSELLTGSPSILPNLAPDTTELVVLWGTNPVVSHGHASGLPDPVRRLRRVPRRWVVDPRHTETASLGRHLPLRPATDAVLAAHLVREVLADGADHTYLAAHAEGVERLADAVAPFDSARTCAATGLDPASIDALVSDIRRHRRLAVLSGTGVTMGVQGLVTEWLLWALQIVTGSFDRPGGVWSNPGYLTGFDARDHLVRAPVPDDGVPPGRFGERACADLAARIEDGEVRGLFVLGGNPLASLPDHRRLSAAVDRLDVLAVADVLPSVTVERATHVLACTDQLERPDVSRAMDLFHAAIAVQVTPALVEPSRERRPLWWALAELGRRLGHDLLDGRNPDGVDAATLIAEMTARSPRLVPPVPASGDGGARVVVAAPARVVGWVHERVLPGGRWQLAPSVLVDRLGQIGEPPPLVLVPRRVPHRMNSVMFGGPVGAEILLHPADAAAAGVVNGGRVEVRSATGTTFGVAWVTDSVASGTVSVPHGLAEPDVGLLTSDAATDELTGMVHQAGIAVEIRPA